jgi:predicted neuraminidase
MILLLTAALLAPADSAIVKSEFVFDVPPTPQCHASTIVETASGLVAAWFGGEHEKAPDVGIWVARERNGAWTAPVEVANGVQPGGTRLPTWNPVLFQPRSGPLLLFYKAGPDPSHWWGMQTNSSDAGVTWSAPRRLPEGVLGPIKNKPIQLADGTILAPSSTEDDGWKVHFERTSDLGRSWSVTAPVNDGRQLGAIQPSILHRRDGSLQAVGRTRQGRIFSVTSTDQGRSWGPMTLLDLPNPNSGIDAVTLADGRQLLVYNHTTRGRGLLNVAVSDDGTHWKAALVLENEPGEEFSYPAVIQTHDGLVHVTYTWKRRKVRHVVIDPSKLELRPIVDGEWPA